jgi:hypothetical protein
MAKLETNPSPWEPAVQAAKHGLSQTRPDDACNRHRPSPGRDEKQGRTELFACRYAVSRHRPTDSRHAFDNATYAGRLVTCDFPLFKSARHAFAEIFRWQQLHASTCRRDHYYLCTLGCGASGIYCLRHMALRLFRLSGLAA